MNAFTLVAGIFFFKGSEIFCLCVCMGRVNDLPLDSQMIYYYILSNILASANKWWRFSLSCILLWPTSSGDTDFKQSFHHSKHGNYQPITWESVLLLSCGLILPGIQLKFSQIPLGVRESSSQGAWSRDQMKRKSGNSLKAENMTSCEDVLRQREVTWCY